MLENLKNESPVYRQLMNHIKSQILSGVYRGGEKLPSIRSISKDAGINPGTVQRALIELENQGLIYKKNTGRFVVEDKEFIKKIQINLGKKEIEKLFSVMYGIGFTKDEIISMLDME